MMRFTVQDVRGTWHVADGQTGQLMAVASMEEALKEADVLNQDKALTGAPGCSPTISALAAALAKAQGQMRAATKDAVNPHFRSKYADLASVWEACRGPLSANGLAVMQRVRTSDTSVTVCTMLTHSSGEWVADEATYPLAQRTPQAIGSAITYARRYALAALVGVAADEDDDGNAASRPEYPPPAKKAKPREVRPQAEPASQLASIPTPKLREEVEQAEKWLADPKHKDSAKRGEVANGLAERQAELTLRFQKAVKTVTAKMTGTEDNEGARIEAEAERHGYGNHGGAHYTGD